MSIVSTLFFFVAGLVLLVVGAEFLVRGASKLAAGLGVPSLVIGLTVVAFGTSAPELAVSIKASLADQANIALGNVVGSNIFNVLCILGLSALICPLLVSQQLIRIEVPLMIGVSFLTLLGAWDGQISRLDGILLTAGLIAYLVFQIVYASRSPDTPPAISEPATAESTSAKPSSWVVNVVLVIVGLGLLVLGSRWLVDSAVAMATELGISELIIGLTIVAAGTSMPEVVTSVVASLRGERDIAVGNVIGSNIFNILGVLGLASVFAPTGIEIDQEIISFDLPIMIAVAFTCLPIFFTEGIITRWEGALLLGYYIAYTTYLILAATEHAALPAFSIAMIYFIIPLTVLTLVVVSLQHFRHAKTR